MMDKIKSLLGSPRPEREEYEQYMKKLQAEDALRNQYSQASLYQQGLQRASQAINPLQQTENRQVLIGAIEETNKVMRRLAERMDTQERRVQMLTGFYTWVTEVHPEIAAQHKAMRDLYEAANAPQQEQGKQA
jgi:site-specific recombinase XerD